MTAIEPTIEKELLARAVDERDQLNQIIIYRVVTLHDVLQTVCRVFPMVKPIELLGKARPDSIAFPRQVAMALLYENSSLCSGDVGRIFGRDHGTVLHAVKAVEGRCETEPKTKRMVDQVREFMIQALDNYRPAIRELDQVLGGAK